MPHFETNVQFAYNGFGVQPRVLDELGVPGGNSHLWSLTVDPKLRLGGNSSVDPYIVGGVGFGVGLGPAGSRLFVEAGYHYADTGRIPTIMIPVTFGLKW